jgi:hypothetical protein
MGQVEVVRAHRNRHGSQNMCDFPAQLPAVTALLHSSWQIPQQAELRSFMTKATFSE